MSITTRIINKTVLLRRRWRAWRRGLRFDRASAALLIALLLALGEPLACILHCEVWLPIVLQSYLAAQHHHHHMPGMSMPAEPAPASGAAIAATPDAEPDGCFMAVGGPLSGVPTVPPSPVHEMLLWPELLLLVVLLTVTYRPAPPSDPPHVFIAPLLRPPILIAH